MMLIDIFMDAVIDSAKMIPFLFAAFCILELFSHHSVDINSDRILRFRHAGPFLGALAGCIPQCGIPVLAVNLYSGLLITPGTLLAVLISSSDEAVLILLKDPKGQKVFLPLLVIKLISGTAFGYLTDIFFQKSFHAPNTKHTHDHHDFCHRHGVLLGALKHTAELFGYLFLFTLGLNLLLQTVGLKTLEHLLLHDSAVQPFLAALIGLIPSCASALLLCELYLDGLLSFASLTAGLVTGTGVGLLVLFRTGAQKKELLKLLLFLYCAAVLTGFAAWNVAHSVSLL